jgi:hypothetical protein
MVPRARVMLVVSLLVALAFAWCGCASTSNNIDTGPRFEQALGGVSAVSVVGDVCLWRESSAGNYVMVEESGDACRYMVNSAADYLGTKGYLVSSRVPSLVGTFKDGQTFERVADRKDAEVSQREAPYFVAAEIAHDAEYARALGHLIGGVNDAVRQELVPAHQAFASGGVSDSDLRVVRDHVGTDHMIVMIGDGQSVSGAKSYAQGCLTGALSSALTGGLLTVTAQQSSGVTSRIGLVDLTTGEMLWSNSVYVAEGDPTSESFYSHFSFQLLRHFPSQGSVG